MAIAIVTGLVFGLAPALHARSGALHDALKDATRGSTEGRRRAWVRNALVVSEIAFACVLLVGAGLLIRSLIRVLDVDMGFQPAHAATIRVDPDARVATHEQRNAYFDEVLRRVKEIPGVESAAITDALPLGSNRSWGARAKGVTYERGQPPVGVRARGHRRVSGGAGHAARRRPRLLRARHPDQRAGVADQRDDGAHRVPGTGSDRPVHPRRLREGTAHCRRGRRRAPPRARTGVGQRNVSADAAVPRSVVGGSGRAIVARAEPLAGALREALRPIAPNLSTNDFRTLQSLVDKSVSPRRFMVMLLGAFAVFALVLASLGIYGLISYSVNQRTQEIGIRMAIGASAGDVKKQIITQTLWLAAIGVAIGAVASWIMARGLRSLLFEVTASDPGTFAAMLIVLTSVAVIAGYLPARRASGIDPMVALRSE